MNRKLIFALVVGCAGAAAAVADNDYDLKLNGDFRGAAPGAAIAPGWVADTAAGSTKIVAGDDHDEFAVEITASAQSPKSVYSDFFPVMGNVLEIESEIKGTGNAFIGYAAFDAAKNSLPGGSVMYDVSAVWTDVKYEFPITNPEVKFVRVFLSSADNSSVTFAEVDAEFKTRSIASVQPAPQPAPAPAPQPMVQTAPQPAPAPAVVPAAAQMLIDGKYFSMKKISGSAAYYANVPLSDDIDFELEEDADSNLFWTVSEYDSNICRVKIEHDRDGVWPFRHDKAEIELEGLSRGTTTVVFSLGATGKTFTVVFNVR